MYKSALNLIFPMIGAKCRLTNFLPIKESHNSSITATPTQQDPYSVSSCVHPTLDFFSAHTSFMSSLFPALIKTQQLPFLLPPNQFNDDF